MKWPGMRILVNLSVWRLRTLSPIHWDLTSFLVVNSSTCLELGTPQFRGDRSSLVRSLPDPILWAFPSGYSPVAVNILFNKLVSVTNVLWVLWAPLANCSNPRRESWEAPVDIASGSKAEQPGFVTGMSKVGAVLWDWAPSLGSPDAVPR